MKHYVIAGAAIVTILVVAGIVLFVLPDALADNTLKFQFYDENGKPVQLPLAFFIGDFPVGSFDATVGWKLTSASTLSEVDITGEILCEVRLNTQTAGLVSSRRDAIGSDKAESSQKFTYYLSTIIGSPTETGKQYGWVIVVTAQLTSSATIDGEPVEKTWSKSVAITITWTSGDYSLDGYIVTTAA